MTLSKPEHRFVSGLTIICLLFAFCLRAVASTTSVDSTLSLETAVSIALANNPKLESVKAQYKAQNALPDQVSVLPEPRLIFNGASLPVDSFALNKSPMTQIQIGLIQDFPYPGKLALRQTLAEKLAQTKKEAIDNTSHQIVHKVKTLWWNLFYLDRSLDIVASNITLVKEFIDVAETKYSVGKGLQQEVLLAHVQRAKLEDNQLQLQAMRDKVTASLNTLLNRNSLHPVKLANKVPTHLPETKTFENLLKQAEKIRPEVREKVQQIQAADTRVALANKDYYPDFKLGAIYGWRQDQTALATFQLSMNLPFTTEKRQDKKKDQRIQEWLQQKYELVDLKNTISEQIQQALLDYHRARNQTSIYQQRIIPEAKQTVDSMLAGYQVNKVDFLNLLNSQINLFNYQTRYWQSFTEAKQALVTLEYAVGQEDIYEK